jgi:dihydrofolate reductase
LVGGQSAIPLARVCAYPLLTPTFTINGGTIFHFVDGDIEAALEEAFKAADGEDVRLCGGTSTVQQYLRARLIDEMHIAVVPILLSSGERLFDKLDGATQSHECVEFVSSPWSPTSDSLEPGSRHFPPGQTSRLTGMSGTVHVPSGASPK